jgi:hypothetical protein
MLQFQNPKVAKKGFVLCRFVLGTSWTLQAVFLVCLVFPLAVTDSVVSFSFTFLSRDECEREFSLSKDIRLVR